MSNPDSGKTFETPTRPQVFLEDIARETSFEQLAPLVIATNDTGRIVPPTPLAPVTRDEPQQDQSSLFRRMAWTGLFAAFCGWLAVDLYLWVASAFSHGRGLGWIASAALAIGLAAFFSVVSREIRSYLDIKEVESDQKRLRAAMDGHVLPLAVQKAIGEVIAEIPKDPSGIAAVEAFQRQVQRHHTPQQQIKLLSQTVVAPLDRRAEAIVRNASTRAFGITAISPTAVTDALFFIAISVRMVRQIAACYGHRPAGFATGHLLRRLVLEAGRLGAIDLAGAALTQHIGGAVAERVAATAAESVYATQRMARLGLVTMDLCRPVPFQQDEIPGMMSSFIGNIFSRRAP